DEKRGKDCEAGAGTDVSVRGHWRRHQHDRGGDQAPEKTAAPGRRVRALTTVRTNSHGDLVRDVVYTRHSDEQGAGIRGAKRLSAVDRFWRRLRRGAPIVVVSGLPRSGTSMAMKMLDAGGVPTLTDGIRAADDSNPKGYFELERVKELDKNGDSAWLAGARGKAVKIISFLLTYVPESYDYQVIFMDRDIDEVLASQNKMLAARGEAAGTAPDAQIRQAYQGHLTKVDRFLK